MKFPTKGFRDTFNLHVIVGRKLFGELEFPYIERYSGKLPLSIAPYSRKVADPSKCFAHFYIRDSLFDQRNGVWNATHESGSAHQVFLAKVKKYAGVIGIDYSIYVDMPLIQQLWNLYRNRAMHCYLSSIGINTIFNVRWGDYRTYKYAFSWIAKSGTIAVGNHGMRRHNEDKAIFKSGFMEMMRRLTPSVLILYGTAYEWLKKVCDEYNTRLIVFEERWGGKQ